MKSIRMKLVTEKGDTVCNEDGTPMTFVLIDEASLYAKIKWNKEQAEKWKWTFEPENALTCEGRIEAFKNILSDKT